MAKYKNSLESDLESSEVTRTKAKKLLWLKIMLIFVLNIDLLIFNEKFVDF